MRNLLERRFDLIPTPASVEEAVEMGTPMAMVRQVVHEEPLLLAIEFEILTTAGRLNLNAALTIKPGQTPIIAKTILDTFRTEALGDIKLAFARGSAGLYGEIFRLDGAVLVKWIQSYLDEKYAVVEQIEAKKKHEQKEDDNFDPKEFYKRVREQAAQKQELEQERKKQEYEDRQKDALFRMQQLSQGSRPKFICDGIEVTAKDEHYARLAYKDTFGKEPETVTPKAPN